MNPYVFANDNAANFTDPTGLICSTWTLVQIVTIPGMKPKVTPLFSWEDGCGGKDRNLPGLGKRGKGALTECEAMVAMAHRVSQRVTTPDAFARQFGASVAGIRSISDLARGKNNLQGFTPGGFKAAYGGSEAFNPRHFAGSVWAINELGRPISTGLIEFRERPGVGETTDLYLSIAAFDMFDQMRAGKLAIKNVAGYIAENICDIEP
jgi:hypothetical protein